MSKEKWAGNKERQRYLVQRILRECKLSREHPVDMAGALGTIIINSIADVAEVMAQTQSRSAFEIAVEGLTEHNGDLMRTLYKRFSDAPRSQ